MGNKRRALNKSDAAQRRHNRAAAESLARWEKQRDKLQRNIDQLKANNTMQPANWVDGQLRYFNRLMAEHMANKPGS